MLKFKACPECQGKKNIIIFHEKVTVATVICPVCRGTGKVSVDVLEKSWTEVKILNNLE